MFSDKWLNCIVGNVGTRFEKHPTGLALYPHNTAGLILDSLKISDKN